MILASRLTKDELCRKPGGCIQLCASKRGVLVFIYLSLEQNKVRPRGQICHLSSNQDTGTYALFLPDKQGTLTMQG